jgi:hypothetical protein
MRGPDSRSTQSITTAAGKEREKDHDGRRELSLEFRQHLGRDDGDDNARGEVLDVTKLRSGRWPG